MCKSVTMTLPSLITAFPQQFLWCSIVERLEHLVLSVCYFPDYCLLTALMSPQDRKCELIDCRLGQMWTL